MDALAQQRIRVMWIAPNLNHYKSRLLSRLQERANIELVVVAGKKDESIGHTYDVADSLHRIHVNAAKDRFSWSPATYSCLVSSIRRFCPQIVLMPMELKHSGIILLLGSLKALFGYKLVSYNHSFVKQAARSRLSGMTYRTIISAYDHVIFYSSRAREHSIRAGWVRAAKTSYAENTLDVESIQTGYVPRYLCSSTPTILFLGRLTSPKGVSQLFEYHAALKSLIPALRLEIVGDGPLRDFVRQKASTDPSIAWHGAIADESQIRQIMGRTDLVLIPGETGLAIVHAFAYGKPYLTVDKTCINHGPELDYLEDGQNGLRLTGENQRDAERVASLLLNSHEYARYSRAAYQTGLRLTTANWVRQMTEVFGKLCAGSCSSGNGRFCNGNSIL